MSTTVRVALPTRENNMSLLTCRCTFILALLVATSSFATAIASDCSEPLLRITADGAVTAGSKESLISSLDAGRRVRIGWRLGPPEHRLTHWADPIFISIFHGNVYAQLPPIHVQQGTRSTKSIELSGKQAQRWYGLISTDGQLSGRSGESGEIEGVGVEQTWCAAP